MNTTPSISIYDMIYHIITWIHLLIFVHHVTPNEREGKHVFLKNPSDYRAMDNMLGVLKPSKILHDAFQVMLHIQ